MVGSIGPRIYNLFPSLIGRVDTWTDHARRAAEMGFDWIFLNPLHEPGASGSLYAVKDYTRFNSAFFDADSDIAARELADFIHDCHGRGLKLMLDLVINHTAIDAELTTTRPGWYRRERGEIYRPRAIDPHDASKVTVWGDLAELDYANPSARQEMVAYWTDYLGHAVALGVDGFRCDAAYKVLPEIWAELIERARAIQPHTAFFAETLGCTVVEVEALRTAGFDYLFNSSKWWDFRAEWLLDQYERFRGIAPSVAFPETHDTDRVAAGVGSDDPEQIAREARFRYLFAAAFSSGVMVPVGYEYGFKSSLHVVETTPNHWEEPAIDISDFIAAVNALKAEIPALNEEGPQRRLTAPGKPAVALFREADDRTGAGALLLMNADRAEPRAFDVGALLAEMEGRFISFIDVTPQVSPIVLEAGTELVLDPFEIHLFRAEPATETPRESRSEPPDPSANRIAIEDVWPVVDNGEFPVKRVVGDVLEVWADIFTDGHDKLAAQVKLRSKDSADWRTAPMMLVDNDRWCGRIAVPEIGDHVFVVEAWRDLFASLRSEITKKIAAGQDVAQELKEGRDLVERAAKDAPDRTAAALKQVMSALDRGTDPAVVRQVLLDDSLASLMGAGGPRGDLSSIAKPLRVSVDRRAARFGAWYELFPRSMSNDANRHGTFDDVIARLPYIKQLGFDVLYFPPIHPIGRKNRKGRNNSLTAGVDDPGSPYAIGGQAGGHDALHPELGSFADFQRLIKEARRHGMDLALDFAIQCSLDHPWIKAHPEWFDWRADGTIKYAENPPKKYEDIVNIHFTGAAFPAVWEALRDVVLFWANQGVRIFRVDNPHTKPLPFWEWMIADVRARHPDVLFLAEAFTRPKMMRRLAKIGFNQSYTYFTWRNTKAELTAYATELTQSPMKEYYRPNFFVNTPDINPVPLQTAPRAAFVARAVLAGTLSSCWGMYSSFELCEATPLPGREEYFNSEKYEIRAWDWDRPGNIKGEIAALNRIRRDNPALHLFANLRFFTAHHDQVLFYGKATPTGDNTIWIAVSLNFDHAVECGLELPLETLGLGNDAHVTARDLITGEIITWNGRHQRVRIDPAVSPCRIWRIES